MDFTEIINQHYDYLSANDKEIVRLIIKEKKKAKDMNSTQLAAFLHVSRTTLLRFIKKVGISSYAEFKLLLSKGTESKRIESLQIEHAAREYHILLDELKKHNYDVICGKIFEAKTIYLYGSGNEQKAIAAEFKRIFMALGKYCVELFDLGEVEFAREYFKEDDLFIAISLSGENDDAIRVVRCVQIADIETVSLTRWENNTLSRMCQENLYVGTRMIQQKSRPPYEIMSAFYILLDVLSLRYLEYSRRRLDEN